MISAVAEYVERYSAAKRALEASFGVSDDLLHVHVGLAIFVVTALLLRRRMRSVWPLSVVAVLAFANELVDWTVTDGWSLTLSALDLVNTMFWPVVLFLLARRGGGVETKV